MDSSERLHLEGLVPGNFAPARGDTTGAVLGQGYDVFYACPVEKTSQSKMNVSFTFRGGDEALEKKFSVEAQWVKFFTLADHRSVDGCRASLYNGLPLEGVEALCSFMKSFLMLVLLLTIHLALSIEAALVVVFGNGLCMACLLMSSTSPSWCRGSFPWSCCSADHGDSPVAVRMVIDVLFVQVVQFHRCWCGGDSCVPTVSSRGTSLTLLTVQSDHSDSPIAVH